MLYVNYATHLMTLIMIQRVYTNTAEGFSLTHRDEDT